VIPKIIWQTHEWEYEDLPLNFKKTSETWQNLNPDWDYKYCSSIDRAVAIKKFDKVLYQYYLFADKVAQSDIWRYVTIYENGGVYADMDSFCVSQLNNYININKKQEVISTNIEDLPTKNNAAITEKKVNNSNFAAIKKSNLIKQIIDEIIQIYTKNNILYIYNDIEKKAYEQGEIRSPSKYLCLKPEIFSNAIVKNKDFVKFGFDVAVHSRDLKTNFDSNFYVNFNGIEIDYLSLCKEQGWKYNYA
jgi:mannosyltransferase OCH1-like enzyme